MLKVRGEKGTCGSCIHLMEGPRIGVDEDGHACLYYAWWCDYLNEYVAGYGFYNGECEGWVKK